MRPLTIAEALHHCGCCGMPPGVRCRRTRWMRVGVPFNTKRPHWQRLRVPGAGS